VSEVSEKDSVLGVELRIWKRTQLAKNKNLRKTGNSESLEAEYSSGGSSEEEDGTSFKGDVLRIAVKQIIPGKDDK
jgi:hypothetical protein